MHVKKKKVFSLTANLANSNETTPKFTHMLPLSTNTPNYCYF